MLNLNNQEQHKIDPKINLLHGERQPKGKKIFKLSKFIIYLLSVLIIAFVVFSYQVLFTGNSMSKIFAGNLSFFKQLNSLAGDGGTLKGENENRINILLLGMGGAGHEGPYLTDTMILASFEPSTRRLAMISIPRDLFVEIPGYGQWKINNANHFGEQKDQGNGALLAKETVSQVFDIPIHYYIRIDFAGFEKLIDDLGGIKVNVEQDFTDFQYPTNDYKYQVISFSNGLQTMDGDTALKFARSRHGNNNEGSDFARSKRQQKIIEAVKKRIFSYSFFLNPNKINKFSKELANHLRTDIEPWEIIKFSKLAETIDFSKTINQVLDDSPNGYLSASNMNGAYVLLPKANDWTNIKFLAKNIFDQEITAKKESRQINIELRNGTEKAGLASQNQEELKLLGFRVMKIGNSPEQNLEQTKIYRLTSDSFSEQEQLLFGKYNVQIENKNIPQWIIDTAGPEIDFFIILGKDEALRAKS
ncbi:MAG: LCP family protein [Patescibacteria group bacterium]